MALSIAIWIAAGIFSAYLLVKYKLGHFKKHGINHLPTNFVFGNMYENFFKREHNFHVFSKAYNAFPSDRFVGTYQFLMPMVIVRDLELIKKIGVKDFDHFGDHREFSHENEQFFSKSLVALKGEKWRNMRSTLSPAFTASKLRSMVPFMQECSKDSVNYLIAEVKNAKGDKYEVDLKDLVPRFATDVIATCAYGLKTNSVTERDNDFYKMGHLLTNFTFWQTLKFFFVAPFPSFGKVTNTQLFSQKSINFFTDIFLSTMRRREENNIHRPDMLQLLMEAQKGKLVHDSNEKEEKDAGFATVLESHVGKATAQHVWDDSHIVAQAIIFFFAGFDTVSTVTTFLLHELAISPEVQERLRQEIDETLALHQGKLDYDKINKMKYLDMCISETLRKWPPLGFVDRLCLKEYDLGKPNDNSPNYKIPKGGVVILPTTSIHYDEKYFPNPHKFDPDRFSDENKHNITPFNYFPFGVGPRNCIGSRFALVEIKTFIIDLISNFEVSPSASTILPIRLDPGTHNTRIYGGHTLAFKRREAEV